MNDRVFVYILTAILVTRAIFDIVFWIKRIYDEKKHEKQVYEYEFKSLNDRINKVEQFIAEQEMRERRENE